MNKTGVDLPHNLVPSLHVVFSAIIVFAIVEGMNKKATKIFTWGWLFLLCLSTLLVHQHHVLDVVTGLFIAVLFRIYYYLGDSTHA
jgi:membrane-associated phospholipid phosphatase